MKIKQIIPILILLTLLVGCAEPTAQPPVVGYWPTHTWQSTTPEQQGMDSSILASMLETIENAQLNLHSVLVVRNGYLVTEAYYQPYGTDVRHNVESNTKSIIGALIGIAIDQKKIRSVDQKLVDFFPKLTIQNLDDQKKSITLKHLLSMTSGLDCQDQTPSGAAMFQAKDWVQYLLDLPVTSAPGKQWVNCSGSAHLLSAVLQKATGMDARTFANRYLFAPLGIPEVSQQDWGADPQGITDGITGLHLTPRELAKFGLLYLQQGRWEGKSIVSASWVTESTTEQAYIGKEEANSNLDRRFGYMFSIFPTLNLYGYLGLAGQELFVLPLLNVVVVFTGSVPLKSEGDPLTLVNEFVRLSVKSNDALNANPQAKLRLDEDLQIAYGSLHTAPTLPDMAAQISGKTYVLDQNSLGWQDMTFIFTPGATEAVLRMSGQPEYKIGLDGRFRLVQFQDNRPVGFWGEWLSDDTFWMKYITLGEFTEIEAGAQFVANKVTLTLTYANFNNQKVVVNGTQK